MTLLEPSAPPVADEAVVEPTLGAALTRAVRTTVPTRLYQILHLALPLAADFAFRGWWRPGAAAMAVAAFGVWGLADRWLWDVSELSQEEQRRRPVRLARGARAVAGTVAAVAAGLLALELFLRLLGAAPTL